MEGEGLRGLLATALLLLSSLVILGLAASFAGLPPALIALVLLATLAGGALWLRLR